MQDSENFLKDPSGTKRPQQHRQSQGARRSTDVLTHKARMFRARAALAQLALACALLVSLAVPTTAFAAPAEELAGNRVEITVADQQFRFTTPGTTFFDISALLPGERTASSELAITNTLSLPLTISINVTEQGSDTALLDALTIIVSLDGRTIANFPAKGQASAGGSFNPYSIGVIPAGVTTTIEVALAFEPGSALGNDLQDKTAHLLWHLRAEAEDPTTPPIPPAGGTGTTPGAGTGTATTTQTTDTTTPTNNLPSLENIGETETPQTGTPTSPAVTTPVACDGDCCCCWPWCLIPALICLILLLVYILIHKRRHRREIEELEQRIHDLENHVGLTYTSPVLPPSIKKG